MRRFLAAARLTPRLGALNTSPKLFTPRRADALQRVGQIAFLLAAVLPVASGAQQGDDGVLDAEPARLAGQSLLLDVARAGRRLVAVGDRGHVLLSDDDGASWQQAKEVPTRNLLTGVCFGDAKHGIAVGHDEVILTTTDAGETWRRAHYAPEAQQPLLDVWCGEQGKAIAVGAYGAFYVTEDAGLGWTARRLDAKPAASVEGARPSGVDATQGGRTSAGADDYEDDLGGDPHLNRIVATSATRLYIAAEAGRLFRSDDGGASWLELRSPYEGSFFGILPLEGDSLLAYGLRGHLFRSDDAGGSWRKIETGSVAMLNDATRIGASTVVIVGLSGALLESRDDGRSFVLRQQSGRKGLSAVIAAHPDGSQKPGEVIVVGEGGVKRISLAADGTP